MDLWFKLIKHILNSQLRSEDRNYFDEWLLISLKFPTVYNRRGETLKCPMPGQVLAPQGFPGVVYIKRGGIHRTGKFRTALQSPVESEAPGHSGRSAYE